MGRLVKFASPRDTYLYPIAGGMGEGGGMGGNMGGGGGMGMSDPPPPPVPPPDPPPPPTPPPPPPAPAAVPVFQGFAPGNVALPGSVWVDGSQLVYVAADRSIWSGTGSAVATPAGAVPGSIYVEGDEWTYIDASGVQRRVPRVSVGAVAGVVGSVFISANVPSGRQFAWVGGSGNLWLFWNGF